MSGLILGGDLMFDRFNALGQKTGRLYMGDCSAFSLTNPTELKERTGHGRDNYGQALDSVYIPQPVQFEFTLTEFNRLVMSIAMLGDTVNVTQTGSATGTVAAVVDEAITAVHDTWVSLAHPNVEYAGVAVKNNAGSTTYVEGTDYNIDRVLGRVRALSGGAITNSQALKVSYSWVNPGDVNIVAKRDAWVKLPHEAITDGTVIVKNTAGSTTYTLGTDYRLNLRLGMIEVLSTGTITADQALKVRYAYGTVNKQRIRGGTLPGIKGELFLDGRNLVTGSDAQLTVPSASLAPTGAISLLNDGGDFGSFQASGRANLLPTETAPYYLDLAA